jgi:hypothetical protein
MVKMRGMTFKKYLDSQIDRNDKVGLLAKKMKKRKESSYEELYNFMYYNEAGDEELSILRMAVDEYDKV